MKRIDTASMTLISLAGSVILFSSLPSSAADGSKQGFSDSSERACADARDALDRFRLVAGSLGKKIQPADNCSCERLNTRQWLCRLDYEIVDE